MPKASRSSFESLLRDLVSEALRGELASLRNEVAALTAAVARRPPVAPGVGPRLGRPKGRVGGKSRGGRRTPGSLKASQVKAIRARLGVSQKRFAALAGVTPVAVYFWESGRTTPSLEKETILLKLGKRAPDQAAAASPAKARRRRKA